MAIHGFAFRGTQDDAVLSVIPPVDDETVFIAGNDLKVPEGHSSIVAAAAYGANLSRAELDSPMLRSISRHAITPIYGAADPVSYERIPIYTDQNLPVQPGEALNAYAQNVGAAASDKTILVWLSDGPTAPITGANFRTVRGTAQLNAPEGAWENAQIKLDTDLPAGQYTVIGFRAAMANLIAARMIFPKQGLRPMVIGSVSTAVDTDPMFRRGGMGALGTFQNFVPPRIEVLASAAATNPTVFLDVVRSGAA